MARIVQLVEHSYAKWERPARGLALSSGLYCFAISTWQQKGLHSKILCTIHYYK